MNQSANQISIYSTAKSFIRPSEYIGNAVQFLSEMEKSDSSENIKSDPINNSFSYYINDYGCRGAWKLSDTTKKFGFFGCSFTFGVGIDEKHTFAKLVEKHYDNIECLNFGQGGSSIQRIAKMLSASKQMFEFDTVVITLPSMYRFLVTDDDNNYIDIVPNHTVSNGKEVAIYSCFTDNDFNSIYTDYLHWILAETKDIKNVIWGTYDYTLHPLLQEHTTKDVIMWDTKESDRGRDGKHPGIESNDFYAKEIIKRLD
jgi:hypothetical protein